MVVSFESRCDEPGNLILIKTVPLSHFHARDLLKWQNQWIIALCNSMELWAMRWRATQDGRVMMESSDKTQSLGEGNGSPLQCSCLEKSVNTGPAGTPTFWVMWFLWSWRWECSSYLFYWEPEEVCFGEKTHPGYPELGSAGWRVGAS